MNYIKKSKYFYSLTLVFITLLVWSEVKKSVGLMRFFEVVFSTLLIPLIISIFLYYLLFPLYLFIYKYIKNEHFSLISTFAIFILILYFLIREVIPVFFQQIDIIIVELPKWIEELDQLILHSKVLGEENTQYYLSLINTSTEDIIAVLFLGLKSGIQVILSIIASSFLAVSLVPIIVLFMLKKANKPKKIYTCIPESYQGISSEYLDKIGKVLSDYIWGKSLVCLYVFFGALITFYAAGLKGALVFAIIAGIMDIVPYFGPWIGTLPAILSALVSDEPNVIIIVIGILIVQLGESYLVSPYIMSKELKVHPVAIIIAMLITGQLFGILGMIIVLPIIAIIKVTIIYSIKIYRLTNKNKSAINEGAYNEE
ncbi:hypothetical protein IGJ74_000857 [Enterococcus sp. AZ009]|uniref:AI-2E family transporter n=1 Tax=Enterococcus TaxID=1350 RepID=UPI001C462594|nr:AI-2E family transporter [Enterococcus casseliflavus]